MISEGGAITEGPRKFIGVMAKNAGAYSDTGGWGFEAFKSDTRDQRIVTDAKTQCFACHRGQRGAASYSRPSGRRRRGPPSPSDRGRSGG